MSPSERSGEIWAIVPVKRFGRAKSRLAHHVGANERVALAAAMLGDVLGTLSKASGLAGVLVVTSDTAAADIARVFGAQVIADHLEVGTNGAVHQGLRRLDSLGASGVIVVPADIPFATLSELRAVLEAMRSAPVVLVPAVRDGGTNVLALRLPTRMTPAFGKRSFDEHLARAAATGARPRILELEGAGHDIDVAADLAFCTPGSPATRTRACLSRLAAGSPVPAPPGSFGEVLLQ